MREHVRVLQARHHARRRRPARAAITNGLETKHEHEREERRDAREHRHDPDDEVARAPVQPDGERRVAGEDQQPEEQRAFLPAPEGGERVAERQRAARVLGDVRRTRSRGARARRRARPLRRPSSRTRRSARSAPRARAGAGASTPRTSRRRARRRRARSVRSERARPRSAIVRVASLAPARTSTGTSSTSESGCRDEGRRSQRARSTTTSRPTLNRSGTDPW